MIYDINKLRNIIEQFHKLTGIAVTVFDTEYRSLASAPEDLTGYCRVLWSNPKTKQNCLSSDRQACVRSAELGQSFTYTCHAGICETVIPIQFHNNIYGYILFGQYADKNRRYSSAETVIAAAQKYNLNIERMLSYYRELIALDHHQIEGATQILEMCTLKIYMEQLIRNESTSLFFDIKAYIDEHFSEDISVTSICNHFYVSKNKLYKVLRANGNITLMQYVNDKRIEKAKKMLSFSDKAISDIAEEVGFQDYNYFIQAFKRKIKMTPLRYRKEFSEKKK